MTFFPHQRDLQCNHPTVNDFSSNDLTTDWTSKRIMECRGRMFTVDVIVDLLNVLIGEFVINLRRNIRCDRHRFDVPESFLCSLVVLAEEWFLEFRLPF